MHLVARDVMNPDVLVVRDNWDVGKLAEFLTEHRITGAPVVNEAGNILGVVSVCDIARCTPRYIARLKSTQGNPDYYVEGLGDRLELGEVPEFDISSGVQERVRDIMTPIVYSVEENCPIFEMADIMIRSHIHRLIVTRGSLLVGIVSSLDLLKVLAKKI